MAGYIGSVGLTGYIAPADTLDTYALQDEVFNRGGFRTVADTTERDAITADRRKLGMLVYSIADNSYYTLLTGLTNSDWQPAPLGGSNTYVGLSDTPASLTMSDLRHFGFASPIDGVMEHTYQIGSNVKYLQPTDNKMTDETSFFICSNFTSAGEVFLPYIDYFNGRVQGQLLMVMGHTSLGIDVKPQTALMGGGDDDDSLRDLEGNTLSSVHLNKGQTVIFTSFYDDPQDWIFLGYLDNSGGGNAEVWQDLNVDSHISDSGQYFTTGDITVTIDDYGDNRKINIKVVSGTCILKTESGVIDGSTQDINLSNKSSVEILCKSDDTYFVKSLY